MEVEQLPKEVSSKGEEELQRIKTLHDEAYLYVSQGLNFEEQSKADFALEMYKNGKGKLDEALSIRCDRSYCKGPKWEAARKSQQKMRHTLQDVNDRLKEIIVSDTSIDNNSNPVLERPPSYEEACHRSEVPSNEAASKTSNEESKSQRTSFVVEEIFTIPDGVQIFYVSNDGNVSAPSYPTSLQIFKFSDYQTPTTTISRPPAWIQIGEWKFPLVPGQSPAFKSEYGAYFFPDVNSTDPGSSVGVILPGDAHKNLRELFEHYLLELTLLQRELTPEEEAAELLPGYAPEAVPFAKLRTSEKISKAVVAGAEVVSGCLVKGAEVTGSLVQIGATKLKNHLHPENQPVTVNPKVQQGLVVLRDASGAARKVSGFVVGKLGELTMALGRQIGPVIKTQGTQALVKSGLMRQDTVDAAMGKNGAVNDFVTVAAGGLVGFSTVYMGLEKAAKTLAYSIAHETVHVVNHKYGAEAGQATDNALFAVGNLALTTHNVSSLGVKSIAKRTAKDTGKAILSEYVDKKELKEKLIKEKPPML